MRAPRPERGRASSGCWRDRCAHRRRNCRWRRHTARRRTSDTARCQRASALACLRGIGLGDGPVEGRRVLVAPLLFGLHGRGQRRVVRPGSESIADERRGNRAIRSPAGKKATLAVPPRAAPGPAEAPRLPARPQPAAPGQQRDHRQERAAPPAPDPRGSHGGALAEQGRLVRRRQSGRSSASPAAAGSRAPGLRRAQAAPPARGRGTVARRASRRMRCGAGAAKLPGGNQAGSGGVA